MTDYIKWTDYDLVRELAKVSAQVGSTALCVTGDYGERTQARAIADELLGRLKELRRLEQIMRDQAAAATDEWIR